MLTDAAELQGTSEAGVRLRVLASSSSGNCTLLTLAGAGQCRAILIDAGLSPRRTFALLAANGIARENLAAIVLTHLDHDHWHAGWTRSLPAHTRLHLHRRHMGRADRQGLLYHPTNIFSAAFEAVPGVMATPVLNAHDDLGSVAFRFEFSDGASLGYATDLGHVSTDLTRTLAGVDVLAIESNYCPQMQASSDRPQFLKDRVTGGLGHLSNQASAAAARAIAPRERVVLLHLSRECNTPQRALATHASRGATEIPTTAASADQPTPWIAIRRGTHAHRGAPALTTAGTLWA